MVPKTLRMKILELRSFKNINWKNYLQNGSDEEYLKKKKKTQGVEYDMWPL